MLLLLCAVVVAPLVASYDPGAEWVPGVKRPPPVPPLPPTEPDAEVVGPIVDPRPIIDGNFPVDRNHEFASFFVNDKPRLPESYDKELAAAGLSPHERRHGEIPVHRYSDRDRTQVRHVTRYPSRLEVTEPGRQPWQQQVPPPRPPLPVAYTRSDTNQLTRKVPVHVAGNTRRGSPAEMVPARRQPQQRVVSHRRVPVRSGADVTAGQPGRHIIFPSAHRPQRQLDNGGQVAPARPTFTNQLTEDMPDMPKWPDSSDPADIKRYHRQMRQRMDSMMERRVGPPVPGRLPSPSPATTASAGAATASAGGGGRLIEHHERSSDEPYLRESYKVYRTPHGRRTVYRKHTSTSTSETHRGRPGRSRRSVSAEPLRRSRRGWVDDVSVWLTSGLSSAQQRGRTAAASAGQALEKIGDSVSDALSGAAVTAYQSSGDLLTGAAAGASQTGRDIYRSAGEAYQDAAASPAGRAVASHVDRVLAEMDTDAASEAVGQAVRSVAQSASDLLGTGWDTISDTSGSPQEQNLSSRGQDAATRVSNVTEAPQPSAAEEGSESDANAQKVAAPMSSSAPQTAQRLVENVAPSVSADETSKQRGDQPVSESY